MSLSINNIKVVFDKHLPKKKISILSYDNINDFSVVDSDIEWYDFDCSQTGSSKLCTIDSIEIINSALIFAEFKNEKIKSGDKLKFLRLKANESIISLNNLVKKELPHIKPENLSIIKKECYFVFSKTKTTPTELLAFNTIHRGMKSSYKGIFYKFNFIDCTSFIKLFNL